MAILQMTINVEDTNEDYWFSSDKAEGNWIVDWGDGCIEVNTTSHYYKETGLYQITVKGDFTIERLVMTKDIISLDKEEGCRIVDLYFCFQGCHQLISVPHDWDVSKVTDMRCMFKDCDSFNQDISHWNLEKVCTVDMFHNCPIKEKHKPKGLE